MSNLPQVWCDFCASAVRLTSKFCVFFGDDTRFVLVLVWFCVGFFDFIGLWLFHLSSNRIACLILPSRPLPSYCSVLTLETKFHSIFHRLPFDPLVSFCIPRADFRIFHNSCSFRTSWHCFQHIPLRHHHEFHCQDHAQCCCHPINLKLTKHWPKCACSHFVIHI